MILIAGIHNLRILAPTGRGVHILDGMYVTNEPSQVDKLLTRQLRLAIGGNECVSMLSGGTAAYWKDLPNEPDIAKALELLTTWLNCLRSIFMALWLVRDNSVNCELGFLEHDVPGQGVTHASNFIAALFSNARGRTAPVAFSVDEIRQAAEYFKTFFLPVMFGLPPNPEAAAEVPLESRAQPLVISAKGVNRLSRLLYFLSAARSANDLGVKVSLYMTCFEIMFSTETTELSHRLSERVAFFLYREPPDRLAAYRRVKRGYNVRSKVIHGSVLSDSLQKELADVSGEIDELLRQLVQTIASDAAARRVFEMDDGKLEDYFTRLAVGMPLADEAQQQA